MKLYKDKLFLYFSFLAAFISFVIYYITKAPTVSFWDCGEFIATSYILGIPHPPGNPLFILMGRLFTMLPIAGQIAVRVNLISVVSSAAGVFVAFWLILRIAIGQREKMPEGLSRVALALGAFSGALIMAFSYTFWSNAVEAEVYGVAMLLLLIIAYLAILWGQNVGSEGNNRRLLLISYLLWLSLGIHPTTFIIAVPVVLYLAYIDFKKNSFMFWPLWIVMAFFILYLVPIQTQILSIFGIDISKRELDSFFVIMAILFALSIAMVFILRSRGGANVKGWMMAMLIIGFAALGYSTQAFIPIRASEGPAINENDPDDWPSFKAFLERKQYGAESMVTRMFRRRASWDNQFFSHPNFGMFRFLTLQYASEKAQIPIHESKAPDGTVDTYYGIYFWIVYVVLLGLFGVVESYRRSPPEGLFIFFTVLLCTVGLVLYLNFSDGTFNPRIAPTAEVRDRDYFYSPGFMLYAIMIGIGLAAILEKLVGKVSNAKSGILKKWGKPILAASLIFAIYLPIHTAFANFDHCDRSGNWIPWDYAYNILQSCDRNGVLFTNGDNDTFPLWFIQQVDKVRTDVRVANLSLLNTPWYIHQLKDQMKVPITLSDADIDSLRPVRFEGEDGYWRVQDLMVRNIVENSQANNWQPPVYFAMTVAPENKLSLDDHLIQEGMVQRIVESTGVDRVNTEVGEKIFGNMLHLRGLTDPSVKKDDNESRLVLNYVAAMFELVTAYHQKKEPDAAIAMAERAVGLLPPGQMWQAKAILANLYYVYGRDDKLEKYVAGMDSSEGSKIYLAMAEDYIRSKQLDPAAEILSMTLNKYPSSFMAFNNLAMIFYTRGEMQSLENLVSRFRDRNKNNRTLLGKVDEMLEKLQHTPPTAIGKQ